MNVFDAVFCLLLAGVFIYIHSNKCSLLIFVLNFTTSLKYPNAS